jgi:hypothetical protein
LTELFQEALLLQADGPSHDLYLWVTASQNINTGLATWTIPAGLGTTPNGAVSGTGILFMQDAYFSATTATGSRRMESPVINLSASTAPYVRFWLFCGTAASSVNLRVVASNDGGVTWNSIMLIPPNATTTLFNSSTPYQRINVRIPAAYMTANTKVGLEMTGGATGNNIWIDDFSVEEFTPVTITSAATGNWSNPATWVGNIVPDANNHVVIAATHTVSMDVNMARCQDLTIQNTGTLQYFSTSTLQLLHVFGNTTIDLGGTYISGTGTTGKRTYFGGNIVNNGTLNYANGTSNTGLLVWCGGAAQTYSGTGILVSGRIPLVWHVNPAGVTYNAAVTVSNGIAYHLGAVNPNGNLTLGNAPAAATFLTERSYGSISAMPIINSTNILSRNLTYSTPNTTTTLFLAMPQQTVVPGNEIEIITGVRTVTGILTMNTHNNVSLSYPLMVGTATTGGFTLTRGIIISSTANLLTLGPTIAGPLGVTPTVVVGTGTNTTTHGSYVAGPLRINFPSNTTLQRNFALGAGTAFNNNMPSPNALRLVNLGNGATLWANQTITMSIEAAPSGPVNLPLTAVMGSRAYRLQLNGGPGLTANSTITLRANNSTYGNSDNLFGQVQDLRIVQAPTLTGTWSERSTSVGSGNIISNTLYTYTSATAAPGPITADEYFAWGTVTPLVPMVYVSSTTTQTNTATVPRSSVNNEIIGIQIVTSGNSPAFCR